MPRLDDELLRTHPEYMFDNFLELFLGPRFSSLMGELPETLMREAGIGLFSGTSSRCSDLFSNLLQYFFAENVATEAPKQIPEGVRRYIKLKALRSIDEVLAFRNNDTVLDVIRVARSVANISYDYFSSQQNDLEYSVMEMKAIKMFHGGQLLDFTKLK